MTRELKVTVAYHASREMFRRATHTSWMAQTSVRSIMVLMTLVFAAVAFTLGVGAPLTDQVPILGYLALAVVFYFWYPSRMFVQDPKNQLDVHYEFSRDGVSYRWAGSEWSMPWSFLNQARETSSFYILELPNHLRLPIPKSAFGPGEEQQFRLLAATSGVPIRR